MYSVRVQIASAKGKDTRGKVQGNSKQKATRVIPQLSHEHRIAGRGFNLWATREAQNIY